MITGGLTIFGSSNHAGMLPCRDKSTENGRNLEGGGLGTIQPRVVYIVSLPGPKNEGMAGIRGCILPGV